MNIYSTNEIERHLNAQKDYIGFMIMVFVLQVVIVMSCYSQKPEQLLFFIWLSFFVPLVATLIESKIWWWLKTPFINNINKKIFTGSLIVLVVPPVIILIAVSVPSAFSLFS